MYQHILVPTDGSDITGKAIAAAIDLAKLTGAKVTAVTVREPYPAALAMPGTGTGLGDAGGMGIDSPAVPYEVFNQFQQRLGDGRIDAVRQACAAAGVPCEVHLVDGAHPWEAIIAQADASGCDLIVMASHGRRGMSALLLGSETQKVLTHTKVPVLVVR